MKAQRPSGICTARYECPKGCGVVMYQVPSTPKYKPVIEHPCSVTSTNIQMKEVKS